MASSAQQSDDEKGKDDGAPAPTDSQMIATDSSYTPTINNGSRTASFPVTASAPDSQTDTIDDTPALQSSNGNTSNGNTSNGTTSSSSMPQYSSAHTTNTNAALLPQSLSDGTSLPSAAPPQMAAAGMHSTDLVSQIAALLNPPQNQQQQAAAATYGMPQTQGVPQNNNVTQQAASALPLYQQQTQMPVYQTQLSTILAQINTTTQGPPQYPPQQQQVQQMPVAPATLPAAPTSEQLLLNQLLRVLQAPGGAASAAAAQPQPPQAQASFPGQYNAQQQTNLALANLLQQQQQQQHQQSFQQQQQQQRSAASASEQLLNNLLQNNIQNSSLPINNSSSAPHHQAQQHQQQAALVPQTQQALQNLIQENALRQQLASPMLSSSRTLPPHNHHNADAISRLAGLGGALNQVGTTGTTPETTSMAASTAASTSSASAALGAAAGSYAAAAAANNNNPGIMPTNVASHHQAALMRLLSPPIPAVAASAASLTGNHEAGTGISNSTAPTVAAAAAAKNKPGAGLRYPPEATASELASMGYLSVPHRSKEDRWMVRYDQLKIFQQSCGHCRVPHGYQENKKLAWWVMNQRAQYRLLCAGKKTWLTPDRVRLLDDIGFEWNPILESGNKKG